jgi:hypothetical protein
MEGLMAQQTRGGPVCGADRNLAWTSNWEIVLLTGGKAEREVAKTQGPNARWRVQLQSSGSSVGALRID